MMVQVVGFGVQGVGLLFFFRICEVRDVVMSKREARQISGELLSRRPDFLSPPHLSLCHSSAHTLTKPLLHTGLLLYAHFSPNITVLTLQTLPSFYWLRTRALSLLSPNVHRHLRAALHLSHLLPSCPAGKVRSVLANAGHRDLRPHPGHSAGYSGAGNLLRQDLRSLQGNMACAADCNGVCCVLICWNIYGCWWVCVFTLQSQAMSRLYSWHNTTVTWIFRGFCFSKKSSIL